MKKKDLFWMLICIVVVLILFVIVRCIHAQPSNEPTEDMNDNSDENVQPLGINAGSYIYRFDCEETKNYFDYYLHIPENAVVGMPLVIYLHGDGEVDNIALLENDGPVFSARELYGEDFPFICLSPSTRVYSWIDHIIPQTLFSLIDHVVAEYSINTEQIIITGHSRGAIGVWNMISLYGDYFAAAVPVSCPHEGGFFQLETAAQVPVWAFCGDVGERELSYQQLIRDNVDAINATGGWAKFSILEGLDHGATKTAAFTEETFEWMLSQNNK